VFTFNGISASAMGLGVTGVRRSILPTVNNSVQEVPGMAGAFLMNSNVGARRIEVDVYFVGTPSTPLDALEDVMEQTHDIAAWLFTQSPLALEFDDEPDKVYYAMLAGDTDLDTVADYRAGTLSFICYDPYAYADTPDEYTITAGEAAITNGGTVETFPVVEVTVDADTSFAEVICADTGEYVRVGAPAEEGSTPEGQTTTIFDEDCFEMDWTPTTYVTPLVTNGIAKLPDDIDNPMEMGADTSPYSPFPTVFSPLVGNGYLGYGDAWHGPAVYRSVSGDPADDFYFECKSRISMWQVQTMARLEWWLLDGSDNNLVRISLHDNWSSTQQLKWTVTLGESPGVVRTLVSNGPATGEFDFVGQEVMIQAYRTASKKWWTFNLYRQPNPGNWQFVQSVSFYDADGDYDAGLAKVVLWAATYGERPYPDTLEVDNMLLSRISTEAPEYPIIAEAGDTLSFDMRQGIVLLNGSPSSLQFDAQGRIVPMSSLVDYGSTFFTVPTGDSDIEVLADDGVGVTGTVSIYKRWL
jgi:predicted phage tail component-like protein